jgi:hypothetical protein
LFDAEHARTALALIEKTLLASLGSSPFYTSIKFILPWQHSKFSFVCILLSDVYRNANVRSTRFALPTKLWQFNWHGRLFDK